MENQQNKKLEYSTEKISDNVYLIREGIIVNCYLVVGEKKALLIDCGMGTGNMMPQIRSVTDKPVTVVATHGHVDHIGGIREFGKLYINYVDLSLALYSISNKQRMIWCKTHPVMKKNQVVVTSLPHTKGFVKIIPFGDGKKFDLGGRVVIAHRTSGHSLGHCFFTLDDEKIAFVGDNFIEYLALNFAFTSTLKKWSEGVDILKKYADGYTLLGGHANKPISWNSIEWQKAKADEIVRNTKANSKKPKKLLVSNPDNPHLCICYKSNNII